MRVDALLCASSSGVRSISTLASSTEVTNQTTRWADAVSGSPPLRTTLELVKSTSLVVVEVNVISSLSLLSVADRARTNVDFI